MFKNIFALLVNTATTLVGDTGYLDMMTWSVPVKGEDKYGRPFFSLPLRTEREYRITAGGDVYRETTEGMVTFFQRYRDRPDLWVTASSHIAGEDATPLLSGAIKNPDNGSIEELMERLVKGETVTFEYAKDMFDGAYYKFTAKLLTEAEVQKQLAA